MRGGSLIPAANILTGQRARICGLRPGVNFLKHLLTERSLPGVIPTYFARLIVLDVDAGKVW